jgi:hypothetical protein
VDIGKVGVRFGDDVVRLSPGARSSTTVSPTFSSRCAIFVVPGMGTI